MEDLSHGIVFTHGDLRPHNIMVEGGRIMSLLDCESAGWYGYWGFTTALRFTFEESWWYDFVIGIGGGLYMEELKCERALTSLTSASYYW